MIHILDKQDDYIVATLSDQAVKFDEVHKETLKLEEYFSFSTLPDHPKTRHLYDRNRILIPSEDYDYYHEFIIEETEKYMEGMYVAATGSHYDLEKAGVIAPQQFTGATLNTAMDTILADTEWQRGETDHVGSLTVYFDDYTDKRAALKHVATVFDVELRFRVQTKGNRITGRYVDAFLRRGRFTGKEITVRKDMTEIKQLRSTKDVVTSLYCITPEKDDGTRITTTVTNESALQMWGRNGRHLTALYEPESERQDMTLSELTTYGTTELGKRIAAAIKYEVSAVSLENLTGLSHEEVSMGDSIRIKNEDFSPAIYLDARVVQIERNPSDPKEKVYVLGDYIEYTEEDINALKRKLERKIANKAGKKLFNSLGEIIGELNDNSNFADFSAGNFFSPSVPAQSQKDMTFFVSDRIIDGGAEPNDDNPGESWAYPLRTVAEALRRIPKQLDHTAKILLAYGGDFFEYIRVDGYGGSGEIIIDGQGKTQTKLRNGITVLGSYVDVLIEELTVITESTFEVISANAGNVKVDQCVIKGHPTSGTRHGIYAYDGASMIVSNSSFYDLENCLNTDRNGNIFQVDNTGIGSKYGLRAAGGDIRGYGTAPGGSIANTYKSNGGNLNPADFTFPTASNPDPVETVTITKQWSATDSDSYSYGQYPGWRVGDSDVLQGSYYGYGPYKGLWFFGSSMSTEISGKTIKQIRIKVTRDGSSGSGQDLPIEFRPHGYATKPSGSPSLSGDVYKRTFDRSQTKWVTLPSSYHSGFSNATFKGIGIYSGSSNYARMKPTATIEITYEG